jgi:hypothetical protein
MDRDNGRAIQRRHFLWLAWPGTLPTFEQVRFPDNLQTLVAEFVRILLPKPEFLRIPLQAHAQRSHWLRGYAVGSLYQTSISWRD